MRLLRPLRDTLWLATQCLVVTFVLMVLDGSLAQVEAAPQPCGDACPCEAGTPEPVESEGQEEADACGEAGHAEGPCEEECPAGCPSCSCCPGHATALLPSLLPSGAVSYITLARAATPAEALSLGAWHDVFRPPRV